MNDLTEIYYRNWDQSRVRLATEIIYKFSYEIILDVEVDGFKGIGSIVLTEEDMLRYRRILEGMRRNLEGECRISDTESSNAFLEFSFKNKEFIVSGCIGDYTNELHFEFYADQTVLYLMLSVMEKAMNKRAES